MLKIAVFDNGWGGENVANFLSKELKIIEVIRVIDWAHASCHYETMANLCRTVEAALRPLIHKVDAIVLGGYVSGMALEYLKARYPEQVFISVGVDRKHLGKTTTRAPAQVVLLMNHLMYDGEYHRALEYHYANSQILTPNCTEIEARINHGVGSIKTLEKCLSSIKTSPERVILLNTHFWHLTAELESFFGWRTQVVDFRKKLLRDLCLALKLRGVDGGRPL